MTTYTPHPLVPKGQGKTSKTSAAYTSTSTGVAQYTHEQAQAYALQAFQNAIGRAPTSEELDAFVTSFNAMQTPQTTTTRHAAGGKSSFSTTTGGTDESMLAQNLAQQNPEFENYQKATTYFDAFNQVMNSRGGAGL